MSNLTINGVIVSDAEKWIYDYFGMEATCPNDVKQYLSESDSDAVTVEVNSGGGDVFAGNEIYYALHECKKDVTIDITGFAGSAATVICCAGNKVRAVPSAMYMIHNVSSGAQGDYNEMKHQAEVLKSANKAIADVYVNKTGMEQEALLALMNKETWMSAGEARDYGFIDEIIGEEAQEQLKLVANASLCNTIPESVIKKMQAQRQEELLNAERNALLAKVEEVKLNAISES